MPDGFRICIPPFRLQCCFKEQHFLTIHIGHCCRYPVAKPLACDDRATMAWPEVGLHRHIDLPYWDEMLQSLQRRNDQHALNFTAKLPKVVFRGEATGIEHTCSSGDLDRRGPVTVERPNATTWKTLGTRLKLIHIRQQRPDLLDLHLGHTDQLTEEYRVDFGEYSFDSPAFLSMDVQFQRFRFVLSIGRKNCWADRLRYLLLSPCLVLLQVGRPCQEFWEQHLMPYVHYVPVDSQLDNLTAAIEWAIANPTAAQRIVRSANKLMQHIWSANGIYYYVRSLLRELAKPEAPHVNITGPLATARLFRCHNGVQCKYGYDNRTSDLYDSGS